MVLAAATAVVYLVFWMLERRSQPPSSDLPRGPVGPDDDDDFLRELDRRRRHDS